VPGAAIPVRKGWFEGFRGFALLLGALQGCVSLASMARPSDPLSADQHVQLGVSYESQGMKENADRQYQAALRLQRRHVPALIARGNLAFERGDLKEAESCYRRVLKVDPRHVGANNNLAEVYLARRKDLDKAESCVEIALNRGGPLRPYVLETLARLRIRQARYPEAEKVLEQAAVAASPDDRALRDQLGRTREELRVARK
jgi:tetratricopeptide (TPR) repeat protein